MFEYTELESSGSISSDISRFFLSFECCLKFIVLMMIKYSMFAFSYYRSKIWQVLEYGDSLS